MSARKKVLFVTENVTLSQVVRLRVLAGALDPERFEIVFAAADFEPLIFADARFEQRTLHTRPAKELFNAMERGQRLYNRRTLERYVRAELTLIEEVKPDLVVGDFRLSLCVSAAKLGVPHAAMINAYFSPYRAREGFPLPEHPIVRLLGVEMAGKYFPKALPWVFDHFAAPVNALRKQYGLPSVGSLLEVLSAGDYTLYPDVPTLTPTRALPNSHRFVGPVVWSPAVPWRTEYVGFGTARPFVYVTLGSSGDVRALATVVEGLRHVNADVLIATANRASLPTLPAHMHVAGFVSGDEAARRASLVICNGGSSTGYQALAQGVPVLGIPSNLDQYLAMTEIEAAGAGVLLRAGTLNAQRVHNACEQLLGSESHKRAAQKVAGDFAGYDARRIFADLVAEVCVLSAPAPGFAATA
jgi:UDP:flavonoid glycosyltransferase YjiC (YdhE family)